METIYLDHNATTPIRPEVIEAMQREWAHVHANPASQHRPGQQARWALEHARARIAELLGAQPHGADPDRVVFTSGGTEANNLALLGIARAANRDGSPQIIISPIEHASVVGAAECLLDDGWRVDSLPVTPQGVVNAAKLDGLLSPNTRLVSTMLANHETGVMQPIAQMAQTCHAAGVLLHTDAVQAAGKIPVDFGQLGVDAMTVSAHKFHGPVGIGALVLGPDVTVEPQILGGHQQEGLRGGTESIALAVGMLTALELACAECDEATRRMTALRDRFEQALKAAISNIVVHGQSSTRLPQTSNIAFPAVDGQVLFTALDTVGVACSIGSACDSSAADVSPTLRAMEVPRELLGSSLRFSFAVTTTEAEIDEAASRIIAAVRRLRD
ncbi:MAG: cysteine desulfurase [Pirellulales bacterium]|nr:cysteine desulfurase [Pirellulales bacterium]